MSKMHKSLDLVLLGKAGVGKSATGNTILGEEAFISKKSFTCVTRTVAVRSNTVFGQHINVYDTPGILDKEQSEEAIQQKYKDILQLKYESGRCVFLLVIKAGRVTDGDIKTVEKIERVLGAKRIQKTWILITKGDQLENDNMTIEEFISDYKALNKLLQKYHQRYHVFNNNNREHIGQVQMLLRKICGTNCDTTETTKPTPADRLSSMRIVLLGKNGVGRSSSANTILGWKEFRCMRGMTPVTRESTVKHASVSGRSVSVVDTPGFFDTRLKPEQLVTEIMRCVDLSSPGPHAFLIVFRVDERFTYQEQLIPQIIEMMFGEEVLKYSIILFTHGDQLEGQTVEKLIQENCRLRDLVDQCGGRFHIFNNTKRNREQVNDLLQKIDSMIEQNGGGHYSNQMFEDVQRFSLEEEEQRLREEEERKLQVERQTQEEIERVRRETEERVRAEIEAHQRKQAEKLKQEEIESVRKETEEKIRAEFKGPPSFLLERLKQMRQREEERRRRQEEEQIIFNNPFSLMSQWSSWTDIFLRNQRVIQRQEEIERVIKETAERIRAEFEGPPRRLGDLHNP